MTKKQIIFHPDKRTIEFEGKRFREKSHKFKKIDGIEHTDKVIFEEISYDDEQKRMFIKERLIDYVPLERVIEEVVKKLSISEISRIYRILKREKVEIRKQDGCLGLKIDGGKNNTAFIGIFD